MNRSILSVIITTALSISANAQGTYRTVTIYDIQYAHPDSLKLAEQLQRTQNSRWSLQASRFAITPRETVEVVAQCLVPPKVITWTGAGWTLVLKDTATNLVNFAGLFARASSGDTSALKNEGFLNIEAGDVIRLRGYVTEFPSNDMSSGTQFVPIPGINISVIETRNAPKPIRLRIGDFHSGVHGSGYVIKYSSGELYEGAYVELLNLDVSTTNSSSGVPNTLNLIDADNNMITTHDGSRWFTTRGHRDPLSTYVAPAPNSTIDTIRGVIMANSAWESRGYLITPIFPGDITVGKVKPWIGSHRREPVVVSPVDSVTLSVRSYGQPGGAPLRFVVSLRSINNGVWILDTLRSVAPDTFRVVFPKFAANTRVKYFFKAVDTDGNETLLANSSSFGASDTSQGFFSYVVLDRNVRISDIQYTEYPHGRTPYLGSLVTLSGIVTADSSDVGTYPFTVRGTSAWYMQDGNSPWSGIWIFSANEARLAHLTRGDSISVSGTIQEASDVTRISIPDTATSIKIHARSLAIPSPVSLKTGDFGPAVANGAPIAEKWEGMLVRFDNVRVTNVWPTFSDQTEYELDDGTGPIIVRQDGKNRFSNIVTDTSRGKTILNQGDSFTYVQGIIYFSYGRYKLVPRKDSDFGMLTTSVMTRHAETMPGSFDLAQNYPNPFNPLTTIQFDVPQSANVRLSVYNMLGQEVRLLLDEQKSQGRYSVRFDARLLPSGVYFYRLVSGEVSFTKRMVLIK